MHRILRTPLFLCALAVLPPSLSRAEPPAGDKYALLVGVHQYDKNELRDLPYAEADMEALADVLKKAGYKRVVVLTQSEGAKEARFLPMAANIRKTLKGMLEDLSADDSVLVAFAGHGIQYKDEDDNYFCPMDAKLADKTTLVSLSEVYKQLDKSGAGMRLLLADCCRNDPRSDDARAVDRIKLESVTRPQRALPPGGVAAFFSCSAGEKAYENAELKHGVFFHFIIEGLQGKADQDKDGQVDLDELVGYTKKQVRDFVKETYGDDVRQMPELVGKTHGQVMLAGVERPWVQLFNGKDLTGWAALNGAPPEWDVKDGYVEAVLGKGDIRTKETFGPDFKVHVEFWLPLMPDAKGQARANSGILIQGRYEVQILDSYMNDTHADGSVGALYDLITPDKEAQQQAIRPPEQWQSYDITFRAPRVDETGKVTRKGRITVVLNDVPIIKDGQFDKTTPYSGATEDKLGTPGPIRLQEHGAKVRFRNIKIQELSPAEKSDAGSPVKP